MTDNRETKNANERRRRAKIKAGLPCSNLVDAEPVRQHVESLRARGMGVRQIADTAGVARNSLQYLLYGIPKRGLPPARHVHIMNAKRVLAVRFDVETLDGQTLIDGTGVRRRIQALVAQGWNNRAIAARLGLSVPGLGRLLTAGKVQAKTHRMVVAVHRELWNVQPPQETVLQRKWVALSKRRAMENGWVPTQAWDDIDNDPNPQTGEEPGEIVDDIAVRRVIDGTADPSILNQAEKHAAARLMHRRGHTRLQIEQRLCMAWKTVKKVVAA